MLNDFPSKLTYRNLVFSKKVKLAGTVPVIAEDSEESEGVVTVKLPTLSNKEIPIDEKFEALYRIDVNKIPASVLDEAVLTTKELAAQAYCVVFAEVIKNAVQNIMNELRAKAPSFTDEIIVGI